MDNQAGTNVMDSFSKDFSTENGDYVSRWIDNKSSLRVILYPICERLPQEKKAI